MQEPREKQWYGKLIRFWWVLLPTRVHRYSAFLSTALTDGLHLLQWLPAAAVLPPLALAVGLAFGVFRFGAEDTFTQSLVFMAGATVLGVMAAHLGVLLWVGYVLGDALLYKHPGATAYGFPESCLRVGIPLLISYVLLGILTVWTPMGMLVARRAWPLEGQRPIVRLLKDVMVNAGVAAVIVSTWVQAVPVLIRPVFTWQGQWPAVEAITPLQTTGWVLVVLAMVIGLARALLDHHASDWKVIETTRELVESFGRTVTRRSLLAIMPQPVRIALAALALTLLLAGIVSSLMDGIVLFLFLAVLLWFRARLLNKANVWTLSLLRIPFLLRILVGSVIGYYASSWILQSLWHNDSFQPVLLSVAVWIALLAILVPQQAPTDRKDQMWIAGVRGHQLCYEAYEFSPRSVRSPQYLRALLRRPMRTIVAA